MKYKLYIMVFSLCPLLLAGQGKLNIGDTLHVLPRYLPDKKKMVIIDFWDVSQNACIEMLPRLDSLQKQFADDVQLLVVDVNPDNDTSRVGRFFRDASYRYIPGDTTLKRFFPHRSNPHCVWVNGSGVIIGITNAWDVTSGNITDMISQPGKTLNTKTEAFPYNNDDSSTRFTYRSVITEEAQGYGIRGGFKFSENGMVIKHYVINETLRSLLQRAWPGEVFPPDLNLPYEKRYCYELHIPPTPQEELQRYLQEDLSRYFRIKKPKN